MAYWDLHASLVTLFILFAFIHHGTYASLLPQRFLGSARSQDSPCPNSSLLRDILVVVRTGATESLEKLATQLETGLTCIPDYVIVSDLDEQLHGHRIHDVLSDVSETLHHTEPEFQLYNELRTYGRAGLKHQTIFSRDTGTPQEDLALKLNKWKYLPMVDKALGHRPGAKWFVFIDADTYVVWRTMVEWLAEMDHKKPHYIGRKRHIGYNRFAHGSSGFVLSNIAAAKVAKQWREHQDELEQFTRDEYAGDMILGKALKDAGVELTAAFPDVQGDSLSTISWNLTHIDREPFCHTPVTFAGLHREEFELLWDFEKEWQREHIATTAPSFRDVFEHLIHPHLSPVRADWDNMSNGPEFSEDMARRLSGEEKQLWSPRQQWAKDNFDNCRAVCEVTPTCLQWSYEQGKCRIASELRLGHPADSRCLEYSTTAGKCVKYRDDGDQGEERKATRSGWLLSRVADFVRETEESCTRTGKYDF